MLIKIAMSWAETIHRYSSSLSRKTRALKFALCIISTCASFHPPSTPPSIYSLAFSTGKRGRSGERREDNFVSECTRYLLSQTLKICFSAPQPLRSPSTSWHFPKSAAVGGSSTSGPRLGRARTRSHMAVTTLTVMKPRTP